MSSLSRFSVSHLDYLTDCHYLEWILNAMSCGGGEGVSWEWTRWVGAVWSVGVVGRGGVEHGYGLVGMGRALAATGRGRGMVSVEDVGNEEWAG